MVKHMIVWTLKDEYSAEEKVEIKCGIKEGLRVWTDGLPSSTGDLMLDSLFEDAEALKGYSTHPEHVAVANGKVRPYTKTRSCFDFEVEG